MPPRAKPKPNPTQHNADTGFTTYTQLEVLDEEDEEAGHVREELDDNASKEERGNERPTTCSTTASDLLGVVSVEFEDCYEIDR